MEFVRTLCRLLVRLLLAAAALALIGLILCAFLLLPGVYSAVSASVGEGTRSAPLGVIAAAVLSAAYAAGCGLLLYGVGTFAFRTIRTYNSASVRCAQFICTILYLSLLPHLDALFQTKPPTLWTGVAAIVQLGSIALFFLLCGWLLKWLTLSPAQQLAPVPEHTPAAPDRERSVVFARLMIRLGLTVPPVLCFYGCLAYGRGFFPDFMNSFFATYLQHGGDFAADVLAGKLPASDPQTLILCIFWPTLLLAVFCVAFAVASVRTWQKVTMRSLHLFCLLLIAVPGWYLLSFLLGIPNVQLEKWHLVALLVLGLLFASAIYLTIIDHLKFCLPAPEPKPQDAAQAQPAAAGQTSAVSAASGRWLRGVFRGLLAGGVVVAFVAVLAFLLRWEIYYCERYQRPWHFFSAPVWRLPLFALLCTGWLCLCARGGWFALTRPLTRTVFLPVSLTLAGMSFIPLLYLLERYAVLRLPMSLLARKWVWPEFLSIGAAALLAVLLARALQAALPCVAGWFGVPDGGGEQRPSGWRLLLLGAGAALLTGLALWQHAAVLDFLTRIYTHPKR